MSGRWGQPHPGSRQHEGAVARGRARVVLVTRGSLGLQFQPCTVPALAVRDAHGIRDVGQHSAVRESHTGGTSGQRLRLRLQRRRGRGVRPPAKAGGADRGMTTPPSVSFILLVHKNPGQVQRLVERLSVAGHISIHVDRSASAEDYRDLRERLGTPRDLVWLRRRRTSWGGFGLVEATLDGMEEAAGRGADYTLVLSGQDYPIQPVQALVEFLKQTSGRSYLRHYRLPNPEWPSDGMLRFERWHFNDLGIRHPWLRRKARHALVKLYNGVLPKRRLPEPLILFGGPQWWCLHRPCVQHVLTFTRRNPRIAKFFRNVRIPDEAYFHTVLLNSEFAGTIENRMLTFVDWNGPPYPRVLGGEDDFRTLVASGAFFARKFDATTAPAILDRLDDIVLARPAGGHGNRCTSAF